ncbi:MAG: biotin--[acetyl-CoA-carboxylase] ligase [Chloroflexi bacterium]|nr:biotin--[acetyl-CoA-carboxylase] ligase [Chloroflexota bacterium]
MPAGWTLHYRAQVDSTQDVARELARADAPDQTLVVADHQAAGRGRRGRRWIAPPGTALTFSILFRTASGLPSRRYTMLASVAVCEAIERLAPDLKPRIKWPNDVMLGERKVAGVLAEGSWVGDALRLIVGVGINVSTSAVELAAISSEATSVRAAGAEVERVPLLVAVVERLAWWLGQPLDHLHAVWQDRLWGIGQRLHLAEAGCEVEVVVLGVAQDGRLRVRYPDGSERLTLAGELLL